MAGALAKFAAGGALQLNDKEAAGALRRTAGEGQTGGGDKTFLSFSGKKGVYSLGRDKDDVDPDTVFMIEPLAAIEGWTCWKGGRPAKKHEWSVYDSSRAVRYAELEDLGPYNERMGEGWQQMMGIGMIDPLDPSNQILFTTTSISGRNVLSDLSNEIAEQMEAGEAPIALVTFDVDEFEAHSQKNFKPVISVQSWVTREEVEAFLADDSASLDDLIDGVIDPVKEEEEVQEEAPKARPRARRTKAA